MFEFLFNHSTDTWAGASLVFSNAWPWWLIALAFAFGVIGIVVSLLQLPVSIGRRFVVGCIQSFLLAVVMTMLLQPALLHEEVRRDDNVVAVLIDTSNSMEFSQTANVGFGAGAAVNSSGAQSRFEAARDGVESIRDELSDTFETRLFSIGEELAEVNATEALSIAGERTDLAGGLTELLDQASADELAALVVLSDGGNNASPMDVAWWNRIRQAGVPIHTVGVGPLSVAGDVELTDVFLPEQISPDATITARVRIRHPIGLNTVRLRVTHGNELRYSQEIELQPGANETTHQLNFPSGETGIQALNFELEKSASDTNAVNNRVQQVLKVADSPKRILYVEGEPRWEYKFLRRAVAADPGIEVVSLLRTSANKFYRQGVNSPRELENGFPLTREALFGYDAVIIGSLDAAELSIEQQANVRDFVAERGGALLMLGGTSGLADGGWGRSVVQAALPVELDAGEAGNVSETFMRERVLVELTEFGERADWLNLPAEWLKSPDSVDTTSFDGEGNAGALNASKLAWSSLPELANVQRVGSPRAGAQVMIQTRGDAMPVLIWHRYGKGRSYVLATSGTWRWQMLLPSEDNRHEVFWQNFLNELSNNIPKRISIETGPAVQRDQDSTLVRVVALGADFTAHVADSLVATVTRPNGSQTPLTLLPDINSPGHFVGSIDYNGVGAHALSVDLEESNDGLEVNIHKNAAQGVAWWMVEENTAEYFSSELQAPTLQRIADETNASYRVLDDIDELPSALLNLNSALTRQSELPLWNMPVFFLLLLLGKLFEWVLRLRWKRL